MADNRPIFLFAFANDAKGSLRLGEEQNACWNELAALDQEGIIDCQRLGFATLEQLYREFNRFNNQVYLLHYGGHTNSELIQLHGASGSAVHLGAKIGQQEKLKLVFLNGCKNYNQVTALFENGVPAVIATTAKIEDKRAIILAQQFYQALAGGSSIRKAFESAKGYILDKHPELKATYRDAGFDENEEGGFSWGLYTQEYAVLDWHIGLIGQESRLKALNRLREASLKRYQAFTDPGGRFHYLRIDEALLAGIENTRKGEARKLVETRIGEGKTPLENSLEALWFSECPHALLAGAGGMGKTVSLIQLWEHYLGNKQVGWPATIFLPLNEFNNRPEKGFIQHYIKEHYGGEEISMLLKEPLQVGEVLYPHLILLLDGFNEVTTTSNELILEINELRAQDKYPGVQLVLSSRVDMRQAYQWQKFHLLELQPLSDEQVEAYLKQPLPTAPRLLELLRNPMMLSIYATQTELPQRYLEKGLLKETVTSTGEMLFNVEMLQRIKIEELRAANLPEQAFRRFVLEHLLPAIGWQMQNANLFFLEKKSNREEQLDMEKALQQAIEECLNDDLFDAFPFFSEYLEEERFEGRTRKLFNQLVNQVCCRELVLLVAEGGNYRFLHQNFRDYFAARHVQHKIRMALGKNQLPEILKKTPLDFYVRQLLGELEGEHYNRPVFLEQEHRWSIDHFIHDNLLAQLLNKCRNIFDRKKPGFFLKNILTFWKKQYKYRKKSDLGGNKRLGYTVLNILTIWTEQRGELSGADLRRLDFQGFSFNGQRVARPGLAAPLCLGIITEEALFPQGHSSWIRNAAYSPDGRRIITASHDKTVKVWDAESGTCLMTLKGHSYSVTCAAYSPNGQRIISASNDNSVKVWDAETGTCLMTLRGHSYCVNSAAYSPDGQRIITASHDNTAKVWDAESGACLMTLQSNSSWIMSASYSPDGRHIITASDGNMAYVWDAETGTCLATLQGHLSGIISASYSPDGRRIITASHDNTAKVWDADSGTCLMTLDDHSSSVTCVAYSPNGQRIITASQDKVARVWDAETGICVMTFQSHLPGMSYSSGAESASYSPDGQRIITASQDKVVRVWDAETGICVMTFQGHLSGIISASYSLDGRRIITASPDGMTKVWDTESGKCLMILQDNLSKNKGWSNSSDVRSAIITSEGNTIKIWDAEMEECFVTIKGYLTYDFIGLAFSSDGSRILTKFGNDTIKIWDAESGSCLIILQIYSLAIYSPDKQRFLTYTGSNIVKIWNAETKDCLLTLRGHSYLVTCVAYSPNGQHIITASSDDTAKVWDTETGKCLMTLEGHSSAVESAYYSLDGQRIITTSHDSTTKVWSAETGKCILTLEGNSSGFDSWADSSDGLHIITTPRNDTKAKVWSAETGKCILILEGHSSIVKSAVYSPDKQRILTISEDNTARVWDAESGRCILNLINIPGLLIQGCDFRGLHPDSKLSTKAIGLLKQYGGIFDKEDARRWDELMKKHFDIKKE